MVLLASHIWTTGDPILVLMSEDLIECLRLIVHSGSGAVPGGEKWPNLDIRIAALGEHAQRSYFGVHKKLFGSHGWQQTGDTGFCGLCSDCSAPLVNM